MSTISPTTGYYPAYAPARPAAYQAPVTASAVPAGMGPQSPSRYITNDYGGGYLATGANLAHIWNMIKTGLTGGKGVNAAFGQLWRSLKGLHGNGIFAGLKGVVGGMIPYAVNSSLFEGAISAIVNGYYLVTGKESFGQFGGNVVGDTLSGFAGGAGAAVGGAVLMAILPFGGTLGMILTAIGGVAGYSVAANMFRSSGIYGKIVGTVRGALG
ncbi:MAG: hypothetical protein JWM80_2196 [Cyanobacteria bacterium RYN_339]|nr:hypothetical protein [Cyanobacteria bacterium RYN_339]